MEAIPDEGTTTKKKNRLCLLLIANKKNNSFTVSFTGRAGCVNRLAPREVLQT